MQSLNSAPEPPSTTWGGPHCESFPLGWSHVPLGPKGSFSPFHKVCWHLRGKGNVWAIP